MGDEEPATLRAQVDALRHENALLHRRLARLERQVRSTRPLVEQARTLSFWDFTPYQVTPDDTWVAVDRGKAMALMGALAGIDHWDPWGTGIEARPQP
ncbi:hypothetical protein GCM10010472_27820 [Pseudonocardia halophobica]|uniref:Uncharacterized protein n=1 Tax=Pseudonocardia halophobica TaxID=29401 RepID=A0A9W6NU35_9PSEU|nr:hypothetical protein [Pseudonocardia halophobica]GLL09041.1 hypothetical protein GCM10017577_01810 [Pseudonocardia halophobica]